MQNQQKKEVFEIADDYFDHAEKYGFSKLARFGIDRVFRGIKKAQVLFPNKAGGRRERLLNGGEKIISEFNPQFYSYILVSEINFKLSISMSFCFRGLYHGNKYVSINLV